MKKLTLILVALWMLFVVPCFATTIQISLDGKMLKTNVAPTQEDNITLVPIRVVSENLGATVSYDNKTQGITITKANKVIKLILGKKEVAVNGTKQKLQVAPKIVDKTTMVPLRFISETMGCKVSWDDKNRIVSIAKDNGIKNEAILPVVTMKIKGYGEIQLELYPEMAPNTVNNFIDLANSGFYDGLIFHRVIKDFMIQGGDPFGNGTGGTDYTIAGEFANNGYTANTLSHKKGILSMARSSLPNSAGSQFFITSADATYLDGEYAAFGKVISGLELVEKIQSVPTNNNDKPLADIVIESIRVDTHHIIFPKTIKIK